MIKNPYVELKKKINDFVRRFYTKKTRQMFYYPATEIQTGKWGLYDLAERTKAASQIGYEVHLRWENNLGLAVYYVEKVEPYYF